ncbi:MAG: T9SS type A sorting domain-containing protein, partial [Candidatus Syntrophosphaera sp.]
FEQTVTFSTDNIPLTQWNEGVFGFSHGDDIITQTIINQTPANEELSIDMPIYLYPNPVYNELFLQGIDKAIDGVRLMIYNMRGQRVDLSIKPVEDASTVRLDVSSLPAGIYLLRIEDPRGSSVRRFIKLD